MYRTAAKALALCLIMPLPLQGQSLAGQATIISAPADQFVPEGGSATFEVVLEGPVPQSAVWLKMATPQDLVVMPGPRHQTRLVVDPRRPLYTARLTITDVTKADAGQYYCRITGTLTTLDCPPACLAVGGLAGYWPLDANDLDRGRFLDRAGDHDVWALGRPQFTTGPDGRQGQAIYVTGPDGWGTLDLPEPTCQTGQASLSMWIRVLSGPAPGPGTATGIDYNEPLALVARPIGPDGCWHHLAIVYDGNAVQTYLDGWPSERADARTPATAALLRAAGICAAGLWPYECELAQIRLYNMALNLAQVADLYEQIAGQTEAVDPAVVSVHDPAITKDGDAFYLFSTGRGIPIRRSTDLYHWEPAGRVFAALPSWVTREVPGVSSLWAPDISYRNGRYYLYYCASTFASNLSCIGLATNVTLDPADPNYRWVDEGKVIASNPTSDYNAIDGNVIQDTDGGLWLAFGSFWTGIKLTELDPATGKPFDPAVRHPLAMRPTTAIEAPFIIYRHGYYYLFVSFDHCCRGIESTYNIRVGRARRIAGPYYDRDQVPMRAGGGTLVLAGDQRWKGPGHNAILMEKGQDYLVYHAYDAQADGASALRIRPLYWSDDLWPMAGPILRAPIR